MSYTPTEWKDRIVEKPRTYTMQQNTDGTITLVPAPGNIVEEGTPVNAANMNKIEEGIESAHILADSKASKEDLAIIAYDLYSFWLEQYYLGEMANGPNPSGARTIMFDGFLDYSNIDTANTTAFIDENGKYATYREIGVVRDTNVTVTQGEVAGFSHTISYNSLSNLVDNKTYTYAYVTLPDDVYRYVALKFDLQAVKELHMLKIYVRDLTHPSNHIKLEGIKISTNGSNWYSVGYSTSHDNGVIGSVDVENSDDVMTVTFNNPIDCRYVAIHLKHANYYIHESTHKVDEIYLYTRQFQDTGILLSKTKTLTFTCTKVRLFSTEYTNAYGTITPMVSFDGGNNYTSGNLISQRTDPKFSGFVEKEYEFNGNGNEIKLKYIIQTTNPGSGFDKVKRYGLFCY